MRLDWPGRGSAKEAIIAFYDYTSTAAMCDTTWHGYCRYSPAAFSFVASGQCCRQFEVSSVREPVTDNPLTLSRLVLWCKRHTRFSAAHLILKKPRLKTALGLGGRRTEIRRGQLAGFLWQCCDRFLWHCYARNPNRRDATALAQADRRQHKALRAVVRASARQGYGYRTVNLFLSFRYFRTIRIKFATKCDRVTAAYFYATNKAP